MAEDFLLEIGTEELPASFVDEALRALPELLAERLAALRLSHGPIRTFGTPRRLAALVEGLVARQPDHREEVSGPPERAAFDAEGRPTRAAEGFARKLGVEVSALRVVETPKGRYVVGVREEPGRPAAEVLAEALPELLRAIPFRKSMRWGAERQPFGRPVQWIVALHGSEVIPFRFADVTAGRSSRGHRFLAPEPFEIAEPGEYLERLRAAHVMADVEERRGRIEQELRRVAAELGGEPVADEALLGEVLHMVEWPFVLPGHFEDRFLGLPESLVVAVMRDHQYYFAVREAGGGRLLPRYLNVVNNAGDPERIVAGNDRVLRARLRDAEFFVQQDLQRPLPEALEELQRVVFHKKLGSVRQRAERMAFVAARLEREARGAGEADERGPAATAARLAKADLVTLTVGEFPELEGEFGGFLVERQGLEGKDQDFVRAVARGIAEHVRPRGASGALPASLEGAAAAAADRLDLLLGGFAAGLRPSGSQDPYGLRRAALGLSRLGLEGPEGFDLVPHEALRFAAEAWRQPGQQAPAAERIIDEAALRELGAEVLRFWADRLEALFSQRHPREVVRAALHAWMVEAPEAPFGWRTGSLRDLRARIEALDAFRREAEGFEDLAVAFKRIFHIAKDAAPRPPATEQLPEAAERALWEAWAEKEQAIDGARRAGDYAAALQQVAELRPFVDRFFDEVFVMVEDEGLRRARLGMLAAVREGIGRIARFEHLGG